MRQPVQPAEGVIKSHSSKPAITPSPHWLASQRRPAVRQLQPASTTRQSELQPSPAERLPSSQSSAPVTTPSPHSTVDTQASPGRGHAKSPSSAAQSAAHPSPDAPLPSSQASPS